MKRFIAILFWTLAACAQQPCAAPPSDAGHAARAAYLKTWAAPFGVGYLTVLIGCTFLGLRRQRRIS